jgi:hypothetical protein
MCRRFIHARAQRSDLAKLFSVDCEKKTFLSERNVLHFLTREEYLFTYRVARDRRHKEREGHTTHIYTRWCALFSLFSLQSDICALIK